MKWLPLPKIAHAIAIHPFTPSPTTFSQSTRPCTTYSTLYSPLLSPQTDTASVYTVGSFTPSYTASLHPPDYVHLNPLEVGDELFIFEQQGQWYRGYVLSTLEAGIKPNTAPIGCFPRSHVQIKEYLDMEAVEMSFSNHSDTGLEDQPLSPTAPWLSPDFTSLSRSFSDSFVRKSTDYDGSRPNSDVDFHFDPESARHSMLPESLKPMPPPLPLVRFDQSTLTGISEPLVDEIGACVSEWNSLLYTYLRENRYADFNTVRDHINYLFQARRQLLNQALSREELSRLRKEIIHRMVTMNLSMDRDMIIRHPERGFLLDMTNTSLATLYRMHWKYTTEEPVPPTHYSSYTNTSPPTTAATAATAAATTTTTTTIPTTTTTTIPTTTTTIPTTTTTNTNTTPTTKTVNSTTAFTPTSTSTSTPPMAPTPINTNSMKTAASHIHHSLTNSSLVLDTESTPEARSSSSSYNSIGAKFSHLLFELKACVAHICQPGEFTELYFSLYNKAENTFITEQFVVVLTYNGMPKDESQIGKLQTLFVDLSPHDLNEGLYLVCRIVRLGGMKLIDKEKDHFGTTGGHTSMMFHGDGTRIMNYFESANHRTTLKSGIALPVPTSQLCRRPFGCAVLHLGGLLHKTETNGFTSLHHSSPNASASAYFSSATPTSGPAVRILPSEHDMRIYTATTESTFSVLHEDIINNSVKDIEKNTRADILRVHLRMLFGQLDQVEKTNTALLQGVPHTLRLGFPDVVFPDDDRNELYITLASGDFAQFGRSRNIQLTLCVRDNITSEVVENALSSGANAPFTTYWESMVFYHDQRPRWGEMIKLKIQSDTLWSRSHVFFTIRHKSSYYASSISPSHSTGLPASPPHNSSEKTIAMGFLPLTLPCVYRDFVADGLHTLYLYKYDRVLANQCAYIDNVPWCYRSSIPSNMQLQEYTSSRHKDSKTKLGHRSSSSASSLKSFHGSFNSPSVFSGTNGSIASTLPEATTNTTTTTTTGKLTTMRDTLTVGTFLCSTQFTQNKTLVKLLNWCDMMAQGPEGVEELLSILDKFTFVGEMEVVKFLGDIFDALLDILACKHAYVSARDDVVDQTLAAIIWVLGIVQDRRFSNFRPVLDVYIEHRFTPEESATHSRARLLQMANEEVTYDQIMKGLRRLCAHPSNSSKAKLLRSSMKVWDYLFRFMVRSRNMQKIREENGERSLKDIMFKEDLQQLLNSIAQMMVMEQPSVMIGTQTLTLQHFAGVLGELRGVLSSKQLVDITTHFVDTCSHFTGKLVGHKLCMILAIVKGPIFNDSTCRFGLAKNVLKWIQMWINSYMLVAKDVIFARHDQEVDHQQTRLPKSQWLENLRLSLTIVSEILDKVRKSCGMASSSLSSSSLSSSAPFSPFSQTLSRPMSTDTMGEEDLLDESQAELISITEVVLQLVPQLLNAYKELQRLTRQAVQALEVTDTIVSSNEQTPVSSRRNSRHSLGMLRERNNSISAKSVINASDSSEGGSKFSVVLQALSTSPSTPFPSTYPFQSSSPKANVLAPENTVVAMVTTGLLDITVVILELFYLAPARQWVAFLNDYEAKQGTEATAALLCKVCHTCMAILFGDDLQILEETKCSLEGLTRCKEDPTRSTRKVPNHWLNMDVIAHHIVLCNILAPAATLFEFKNFLPTTQLEATETEEETEQNVRLVLWRTLFVTLLQTMSSRRLEIENFLPQTQRAVWKLAGNNKGVVGAKVLLQLWRLAGSGHVKSEEVLKPDVLAYFTKKAEVEQLEAIRKEPRGRGVVSFLENDLDMFGVKIMIEKINDTKEKEELKPSSERLSMNMTGEEGAKIPAISILQIDLIPIILRPLCAVAITLHEQSRSAALEVIADIFTIELHMFGELTRIQHLLIATLDRLVMSENKGTEAIRVHMVEELKRLLEIKLLSQDSVKLYEPGRQAVESLSKFMELLLQIRSLPLDDDEFMDERINATLKLMKFIQVIEREEIYIKYVHQLVQLHVGSHNYIEAALTLRFHANLLAWDPYEKLVAIPELGFKAQTSFSRKEKLYWTMIGYLEQGNAWEISVQLCKELAHEYETTIFDFVKLSEVLQRQAQLAQNIVKKERYFPEYFRVGFYGRGFPDSVRNHQYIYRGLEWEKMVSFVERMQNRHPNAQLLSGKHAAMAVMSEEQLKELESSLDGQYLQITAVVPEPEGESKQKMKNSLVPDYVKKYCATNGVYVFSFSRPINKTQQSNEDRRPETDFLNLWTEKTVLTCEDQFPNIARRSKIIHVQVKEVSPIENAVVAVENKNQELLELLKKYSVHLNQKRPPSGSNPVNVSPFSMALNGAVDAPVNGGVPLYRNAFFSQEYWASNPEMHHWIERLKSSIDTQVKIVEQCLEAHNKLVSQDMRPFHSTLVDFYKKNFAEEISRVGKTKKSLDVESKHTVLPETSEQQQRPSVTRQNSTVQPYSPTSQQPSPLMSPVSRAFSIRSPVPEHVLMRTAVENTSISRAESISRSLKMTLRKKSRKKSQS